MPTLTVTCARYIERDKLSGQDPYLEEDHLCFCCGNGPWTPQEARVCPVCSFLICPICGGCACTLSAADRKWLEQVFRMFCASADRLRAFEMSQLPPTANTRLRDNFGLQLQKCRQWFEGFEEAGRR